MTLSEYANKYPITDEERQREANNAEIAAHQTEESKRRELERLEMIERLEREAEELKQMKERVRQRAYRLTQEVYEGVYMGCNASELLLKALEALSLTNNRPQDFERLKGAFKSVYAVGLGQTDARQTEMRDIKRRLELIQAAINDLEQTPTITERETLKDLKRAVKLNKQRLKVLEEQKEQPAQQMFHVEPASENPFLQENDNSQEINNNLQ